MKAVLALFLLLALPARAEFRCVAELRAGFAEQAAAGAITGPAVALCRSLADQLAGPAEAARLILLAPDSGLGLPPAEVAFLSDAMVAERRVSGDVRMGPAVFHDPISVLVPQRSTIRQPSELGGRLVCLMIGSDGQLALEQMLAHLSPAPIRVGFREADELTDAYNVGRCEAALQRMDLHEKAAPVALAYDWQGDATHDRIAAFCTGVAAALAGRQPLVLVGSGDYGGLLGTHLRRAGLAQAIISIDGVRLRELDHIDIGEMLQMSGGVPVVVKSLVF